MTGAISTQKTKLCIGAVSETVTLSFASTDPLNPTISRAAGSFITDGIVVNSVLSTNSTAGNKGPFLIKAVAALSLTIDVAPPVSGFAIALQAVSSVSHLLKSGLWVKEMTTFTAVDGEAADIEATSLDSDAKEFLQGLPDNGNFKADFNHVLADPGQTAMRAARRARTLQAFQCRFSDNSMIEFGGYVKSAPLSGGVDNKVDTSFGIRITGAVADPTAAFVTGT